MRFRRGRQLFSWPRFARCRRAFRRPLAAHIHLSGVHRRPFSLSFRHGGTLRFPRFRKVRRLWSFLLADAARMGSLRVEAGCLRFDHMGASVTLRPEPGDFAVFQEVFLEDEYGFASLPESLDTVVDLGANIGLFSLRAAVRAKRIVAVEPIASNRAVARLNFSGARVAERITLRADAVGAVSGQSVRLWHSRAGGATHSCLPSVAGVSGREVEPETWEEATTISLRDLLDEEGIQQVDLLKCDVEGAEYDVFLSSPPEVLGRIACIVMEAHVTPELPSSCLDRLRSHLRQAGFRWDERSLRAVGPVQPYLIRAYR